MSHFTVAVALNGEVAPGSDLYAELTRVLAPYDEGLECEPRLDATREQLEDDKGFTEWRAKHSGSWAKHVMDYYGQ